MEGIEQREREGRGSCLEQKYKYKYKQYKYKICKYNFARGVTIGAKMEEGRVVGGGKVHL